MNKGIISKRIKNAMEYRKISQTYISKNANIPKSSLSSYLSGKYAPKQTNIYKLAKVLNVNPVWLMGYDVPMLSATNEIPSDELDKIYNKYKHLLTDDDKETILFIIKKRIKNEE